MPPARVGGSIFACEIVTEHHSCFVCGRGADEQASSPYFGGWAMLKHLRSFFLVVSSLLLISAAPSALAEDKGPEYKYVLHISDMDPSKQELILNNARNLLDAFPPGDVEVEIVAYGPGLRLMFAENVNAQRIDSLSQSGVKFSACGNTLKGMAKQLGEEPKLNSAATVVPGGIVRIGQLVKQGYIYVKP
jgi:intracellular sulfur oxidation DsrE/DsrF family protein